MTQTIFIPLFAIFSLSIFNSISASCSFEENSHFLLCLRLVQTNTNGYEKPYGIEMFDVTVLGLTHDL